MSDMDKRSGSGLDSRQLLCVSLDNNKKVVLRRNVMEGQQLEL